MIFKNFEFRPVKTAKDKYELVKWENDGSISLTVGYVEGDEDNCWTFIGCGLRYQEYCVPGLNEFVIKYVELLKLQKQYTDEEMEKFYENY